MAPWLTIERVRAKGRACVAGTFREAVGYDRAFAMSLWGYEGVDFAHDLPLFCIVFRTLGAAAARGDNCCI